MEMELVVWPLENWRLFVGLLASADGAERSDRIPRPI
jgi:hypothetical protein